MSEMINVTVAPVNSEYHEILNSFTDYPVQPAVNPSDLVLLHITVLQTKAIQCTM